MEASELRRGCLVEMLTEPNPVKLPTGLTVRVHDIVGGNASVYHETIFEHQQNKINLPLNRLQGIPLTEDWLKRFGFEWEDDIAIALTIEHGSIKDYTFKVVFLIDEEGLQGAVLRIGNGENNDNIIWTKHEIHQVHQLQNLYHALTGKELTIKKNND